MLGLVRKKVPNHLSTYYIDVYSYLVIVDFISDNYSNDRFKDGG